MSIARPRAAALTAKSIIGVGEGFPRRFFCTSCNKLHVYFLSNLGQGGPQSSIHSHAQDVQEGAIPNQPPRQEAGEKGGKQMT